MLDFPPPTPPWTERRWFRAEFVHGERSEGPFQVGVDLDAAGQKAPVGYVIGDDSVADRLRFRPGPLQIVSVAGEESHVTVTGVHLGTIYTRAGADKGLARLTGEFVAETVVIRDPSPDGALNAAFLFNGPSRYWPAWLSSREEGYQDATFTLDDFRIEVQPLEQFRGDNSHEPQPRVIRATVQPSEQSSPDPDRFIAEATDAIEDALTLMSLLHRGRIHWHERHLFSNGVWTRTNRHHVNSQTEREERDPYHEYPIVKPDKIYDFIQSGRKGLQLWRNEGHPLEPSMAYRINGAQPGSATITQLFTSLFLSLESLTAIHAKRRNFRSIVRSKLFDKSIKPALRGALASIEEIGAADRELIDRKLIELNRPNFRDVLEHLASEYRVTWRDLYPTDAPPDNHADFIAVRNKLFHGAGAVSDHRVVAEIERLQLLLDRLLLRMVGWDDVSDVRSILLPVLRREWAL